jgi:Uma2 family endonuclease
MNGCRGNGYVTRDQYLAQEAVAETKSEYISGAVRAMAGASPEHDTICYNLGGEIRNQVRGSACKGGGSDLRVWIDGCERYYYPDLTITCGQRRFELRENVRALLNPSIIIEVLSKSTEAIDRGEKFLCYQQLESFVAYLLVAQDTARIEMYTKQPDGKLLYTMVFGLDAEIVIPAAECTVRLADIYEDVEFSIEDDSRPAPNDPLR